MKTGYPIRCIVEKLFVYIWEYAAVMNRLREFKNAYGPNGKWEKFFRKVTGYWVTYLYQDTSNPGRFIAVYFWNDKINYEKFRRIPDPGRIL